MLNAAQQPTTTAQMRVPQEHSRAALHYLCSPRPKLRRHTTKTTPRCALHPHPRRDGSWRRRLGGGGVLLLLGLLLGRLLGRLGRQPQRLPLRRRRPRRVRPMGPLGIKTKMNERKEGRKEGRQEGRKMVSLFQLCVTIDASLTC